MSGIVGVWNLDGRPVERALLALLSRAIAHRGLDGEGFWNEGAIGLGCRLFRITPESLAETQPVIHPAGAALVFDGRLDNREELLASLPGASGITRDSPDPDLVLAAYEVFGERFSERLAGDFALALFDPRRQQLLLARDAIGIRPLYYYRSADLFVFASEIKAVLAHPQVSPRPNDDVLAGFLLAHTQGAEGETFFKGISSVPPASMTILATGGLTTRRYWDFDSSRQPRLGSFQEYGAAFRHHLERAVKRRLRSRYPVAVSVSGGLDSSSIFCLAETLAGGRRERLPLIVGASYTSPAGSPSDEALFLDEIERLYGVAIERIPVKPMGLLNGSRDAVWHVEAPFLDEQWSTTVALLDTIRRRGARTLLTGHWADQILFDQAYLIDLVHRGSWRRALAHLKEYHRWFTDADPRWFRHRFLLDLVKYSVPPGLLPVLRRLRPQPNRPWYTARLKKRAGRRASGGPAARPLTTAHARSLYEQARSSHHVLCMEWNNKVGAMHGLEMAFPFLDRDLVSFLMGIPGEVQTWQGVPKALLREAMRGVLPDAIVRRTWKADFSHLVNEGVERDFPQVVRSFAFDGMAVELGYLRGAVLRDDLECLREGLHGSGAEAAWKLSDLLGLELWLQVFMGGQSNGRDGPRLSGHEVTGAHGGRK